MNYKKILAVLLLASFNFIGAMQEELSESAQRRTPAENLVAMKTEAQKIRDSLTQSPPKIPAGRLEAGCGGFLRIDEKIFTMEQEGENACAILQAILPDLKQLKTQLSDKNPFEEFKKRKLYDINLKWLDKVLDAQTLDETLILFSSVGKKSVGKIVTLTDFVMTNAPAIQDWIAWITVKNQKQGARRLGKEEVELVVWYICTAHHVIEILSQTEKEIVPAMKKVRSIGMGLLVDLVAIMRGEENAIMTLLRQILSHTAAFYSYPEPAIEEQVLACYDGRITKAIQNEVLNAFKKVRLESTLAGAIDKAKSEGRTLTEDELSKLKEEAQRIRALSQARYRKDLDAEADKYCESILQLTQSNQ
jgi:hypothetical protein